MRIEQLEYFIETARQQSIHQAGDKLHISHQSLNASLRRLEAELGLPLLERSPRGVTLTPAGECVLRYAQEVQSRTAALYHELAEFKPSLPPSVSGSLSCLVSPHVAIQILPQLIQAFAQAYPNVTLRLRERDSIQIAQQFDQGYEGLALFTHYESAPDTLPDDPHLFIEPLFSEADCAVVARSHPLGRSKSVSLKTLLSYPLALYQNGDEDTCLPLSILNQFGTPQIYMISDNVAVLENAARSGQAVCLAPQRALKRRIVFSDMEQVAVLKIRNYPRIIISAIVSPAYYQTHQSICDGFIETFKAIW